MSHNQRTLAVRYPLAPSRDRGFSKWILYVLPLTQLGSNWLQVKRIMFLEPVWQFDLQAVHLYKEDVHRWGSNNNHLAPFCDFTSHLLISTSFLLSVKSTGCLKIRQSHRFLLGGSWPAENGEQTWLRTWKNRQQEGGAETSLPRGVSGEGVVCVSGFYE